MSNISAEPRIKETWNLRVYFLCCKKERSVVGKGWRNGGREETYWNLGECL